MKKSIFQTQEDARDVLQQIYDQRKFIEKKSEIILGAFNQGAKALEHLNARGAHLYREAAIMRYHANNPGAYVVHDENMRRSILEAIRALNKELSRRGE